MSSTRPSFRLPLRAATRPRSRRHGPAGFTLVECLVALAIFVVLALLAVPSLGRILADQALKVHVQAFDSALRLARSEAMRRGVSVSVCVLDDRRPDAPACAPSAQRGWRSGWLVFSDAGERGELDGQDRVLAVEQELAYSGQVVSTRRSITFHPSGLALNATGRYSFYPPGEPQDPAAAVVVCVNKQGRARVASGARGCA